MKTLLREGTGRHLCTWLYSMRCRRGSESSGHERAVIFFTDSSLQLDGVLRAVIKCKNIRLTE